MKSTKNIIQKHLYINLRNSEKKDIKEINKKNKEIFQVRLLPTSFLLDPNIPITGYPKDYNIIKCPYCLSTNIIKKGFIRHKSRLVTQIYGCKNHIPMKKFTVDPARNFQYPLYVIDEILDLYVHGDNAEFIANRVKKDTKEKGLDIEITKQTVLNIVKKASLLLYNIDKYQYHKIESKEWQIDDCYQRVSKKKYIQYKFDLSEIEKNKNNNFIYAYITNVMAVDTRYWLASQVTLNRKIDASLIALQKALIRAKYEPKVLKSDKWQAHINAANYVLPNTYIDVRSKSEDFSFINFIERLNLTMRNGKIKKRLTFQRIELLKAAANLTRIWYNFLKGHSKLDGKTPAQASGITIPFDDWEDLLKYANYLSFYGKKEFND